MSDRRADLTGADRAVSDTLDELNHRMHGLTASWAYPREFQEWLAGRGYQITPIPDVDPHQAARGPCPVTASARVEWSTELVDYDWASGGFVPTGELLRFAGIVARVEVVPEFPDEWTAFVTDDAGHRHTVNAATLRLVTT